MRWRACIAAFALVSLSACGDDGAESSSTTLEATTTTDATTTTAAAPCEADDLDATELEEATVEDVPAGFERQPDAVGGTGPTDQATAISSDGQPGAEEAFAELRRGYQWMWDDGGGNQLLSVVYEFCDGDGPSGYAERGAELTESQETSVEPFDAPGVDEVAAVFGEDEGYQFAYVDIVEGGFFIHTAAIQQPPSSSPEELQQRAADLAAAQLAEVQALGTSSP